MRKIILFTFCLCVPFSLVAEENPFEFKTNAQLNNQDNLVDSVELEMVKDRLREQTSDLMEIRKSILSIKQENTEEKNKRQEIKEAMNESSFLGIINGKNLYKKEDGSYFTSSELEINKSSELKINQ